jgi:hypothetical protein
MAKKDYVLRDEYSEWLPENGIGQSAVPNYETALSNFIEPTTDEKYVDIIGSFVLSHNVAEALFYLDELESNYIKSATNKNLGSWFNKYRDFIMSYIVTYPTSSATTTIILTPGTLDQLRKKVTKGSIQGLNSQFDAMFPLIATVGVDKFIRLAIEHSIFFDEDAAKTCFNDMTNALNVGAPLYARKSQDPTLQQNTNGALWYVDQHQEPICPIRLDSNGNARVNQMINNIFGYGQPITKFFQNYVISHIWGNAFDPRYFTSLWNLALVPAWANHLMDKSSSAAGTVASKLLDTMKAICAEHYKMSTLPWGSSPKWMAQPIDPRAQKPNDVIKGTYTIKVLRPCNGNAAGEIDLVTITV